MLQISVRASDQRVPERVDDSVVVVDIIRDQNPPVFTNEPYGVTITDNQALNTSIFRVTAFDQDAQVKKKLSVTILLILTLTLDFF